MLICTSSDSNKSYIIKTFLMLIKIPINNIYMLSSRYAWATVDVSLMTPHICPDSSARDAPAIIVALRNHSIIPSNLTPKQVFESVTGILHDLLFDVRLSPYNIVSPQGPSFRCSHMISRRLDTTSFILRLF